MERHAALCTLVLWAAGGLHAVAATGAGKATGGHIISAISAPSRVEVGIPTTLLLEGTVAPGDLVAWAQDCVAAEPWIDPSDGWNRMTTFTFQAAGTFKLCYQAHATLNSVEQADIRLTVVEAVGTPDGACALEVVYAGVPFGEECLLPVRSFEACARVTAEHGMAVHRKGWKQQVEDRPYGCWWQPAQGDAFFNIPPRDADPPPSCSEAFPCLCCRPPRPVGQRCVPGEFEAQDGTCTACVLYRACTATQVPQCNGSAAVACAAAASAAVVTGLRPHSVTAGVLSAVVLQGTVAPGDAVRFAPECGADAEARDVDPEDGTDATTWIEVAAVGTCKLCYRRSGGFAFVEQAGVLLKVVQPTRANVIEVVVTPQRIAAGEATTLVLEGTAAPGDLVAWAEDCSAAVPSVPVTPGVDKATTFYFPSAGSFKLCYRAAGGSDSVEQGGLTIAVRWPVAEAPSACKLALVEAALPYSESCLQPLQSAEACAEWAGTYVPLQQAEDRPRGCWYQAARKGDGQYYFNIPRSEEFHREVPCSKRSGCVCCNTALRGMTRGLTTSTSTTITANPLLATCFPEVAVEGLCRRPVASSADCAVVAASFDGPALPSVVQYAPDRPKGCWWQPGDGGLYFNSASGSRQHCSEDFQCICCGNRPPTCSDVEYKSATGHCTACSAYTACGRWEVPRCNGTAVVVCNNQPKATVIVAVTPLSITRHHPTAVTLAGLVTPGERAKWVRYDCRREEGFLMEPTVGRNRSTIVALPDVGHYKLCYKEAGAKMFVEQVGIVLAVVPPTSPRSVSTVVPREVHAGNPVSLILSGPMEEGSLATWAASCGGAVPDVAASVGGEGRLTTFTPPAEPGVYRLCLRVPGGSDSVEQEGVTLTVLPQPAESKSPCYAEFADPGRTYADSCPLPITSVEECTAAAAALPNLQLGDMAAVVAQTVDDRPAGCWLQRKPRGLYFNVPLDGFGRQNCTEAFRCVCCGLPE